VNDAPHSTVAEASVVAHLLAEPERIAEVVGGQLEARHFFLAEYKVLFAEIVDAYYADEPVDAVSIAKRQAPLLAATWQLDEDAAVRKVNQMVVHRPHGDVVDHALLVRRDADFRALQELAASVERSVAARDSEPEELAAETSTTAMQIATRSILTQEIISADELGRRFVKQLRRRMAARAQGIELGAYFGLKFLDNWIKGLQPQELMFLAGQPGAGKSAVAWAAAHGFASRQMRKPEPERVGALILSLEMGEELSGIRQGQALTGIDGGKFREGTASQEDLQAVIQHWGMTQGIPLYFNFSSMVRAAQLRALIVESIRRHNTGLVVIDHFRYFAMDGNYGGRRNDEDEDKVTFLKQKIAKDLNVAVICLAHTTKMVDQREGGRPKMTDLRGSGQIAAEADQVAFVYRPWEHADDDAKADGKVKRSDAEMIYEKNRSALTGTARFHFDASTMEIR
jgi:replicative DNA helicase